MKFKKIAFPVTMLGSLLLTSCSISFGFPLFSSEEPSSIPSSIESVSSNTPSSVQESLSSEEITASSVEPVSSAPISSEITSSIVSSEPVSSSQPVSSLPAFSSEAPVSSSSTHEHNFDGGNICKECGYDNGMGYIKQEVSFKWSDADPSLTPSDGEVNVLVIPINFTSSSSTLSAGVRISKWDTTKLNKIKNYYCSEDESKFPVTFKRYFERASLGKIKLNVEIIDPVDYAITRSKYITLSNEENEEPFLEFLDELGQKIQDNNPQIDFPEIYDKNNDKCFDTVQFIGNLSNVSTDSMFWPHMYSTMFDPEPDDPKLTVNYYSYTNYEDFDSATTAIHEQGHMFGLKDYYDYSYKVDYVGLFDMQVAEHGDWNAFSKLNVGWSDPTIITGDLKKTTVTLRSNQETNDCLIVPANFATFNGSAFDEYFLIELINDTNNNKGEFTRFNKDYSSNLKSFGCRVYYVNSQLYSYKTETKYDKIDSLFDAQKYAEDISRYPETATCNTLYYDDYQLNKTYQNNVQLAVVQKGGKNTFGVPIKSEYEYNPLKAEDLFYTGDVFNFDLAKTFLTKDRKAQTKMANGETFPYTITFDEVTHDYFTVTVSK